MTILDILHQKRSGKRLSDKEIDFFVRGYSTGQIPDYQAAALLMAIYFQGLNKPETIALTRSMIASGETIDLSSIPGVKVDKHSTGGVGDKTTLVLAPLVAAAGVPVAKLSGRGLGFTGGTIDKLESFQGFRAELPKEELVRQVQSIGIAIAGQTAELVPADKKLYALRDVTATVDNKSLIAASIMSKKIASGTNAIMIDVKCGDGSFMKNNKDAFDLARQLVDIGESMGKRTIAVVSSMEQPLGRAVGNGLEAIEAIETLKGRGPKDLQDLCVYLGTQMLLLAGIVKKEKDARLRMLHVLHSGKGLEKLTQLIEAQGGDVRQIKDLELLPKAAIVEIITSPKDGYVTSVLAEKVGSAAMMLGAGRSKKEDRIDPSAGIVLHKKAGDKVRKSEGLAILHTNNMTQLKDATDMLLSAYKFSPKKPKPQNLVIGKVSKKGTQKF